MEVWPGTSKQSIYDGGDSLEKTFLEKQIENYEKEYKS